MKTALLLGIVALLTAGCVGAREIQRHPSLTPVVAPPSPRTIVMLARPGGPERASGEVFGSADDTNGDRPGGVSMSPAKVTDVFSFARATLGLATAVYFFWLALRLTLLERLPK